MANYKTIESIVVDCSDWGFGEFEVLLTPNSKDAERFNHPLSYDFYLCHPKYCVVYPMFGCGVDAVEEAVELAYYNAPDYIPDFIYNVRGINDCDCYDCEEDCDDD